MYTLGEPGIFFSREHDVPVIKIRPGFFEQKGNILRVVQSTMYSTLGMSTPDS